MLTRRLVPVLLLLAATLPAQDDLAARLSEFESQAHRLRAAGRAAQGQLRAAARTLRNRESAPAIEVLRLLGSQASANSEPREMPESDLGASVKAIVECTTAVVARPVADRSAVLARAEAEASEDQKKLLLALARQMATAEVLREIQSYTSRPSAGFFDGMFPRAASLGDAGADAFVQIYTSGDYAQADRALAAEGVAQLGAKRHIPDVRALYEDSFEQESLRERAKSVLARLGDPTLHEQDLAQAEQAMRKPREQLPGLRKRYQDLAGEYSALQQKESRSPEEETRLSALRPELNAAGQELIRTSLEFAQGFERMAILHQNVRDQDRAELCYLQAVRLYSSIAPHIEQSQQARQQVAIAYYNLACAFALQKKLDRAFQALDRSFRWGYSSFDWAELDGDLAALRDDARWKPLLVEVRSGKAQERWKTEPEPFPLEPGEVEKLREGRGLPPEEARPAER
jgi:hypothetical protein